MDTTNNKNLVFPNIPEISDKTDTPINRPWVQGWSVTKEELLETLPDGTFTMSQLDISISNDEYVEAVNQGIEDADIQSEENIRELTKRAKKHYGLACEIGCAHCFECQTKTINKLMTVEEIFNMLLEAKKLGLKNVKFLGPGELMHNPRLFEILDFFEANDINLAIFTKGLILGSDERTQRIFGISASELCNKLANYRNVSILLSLTSADKTTELKRTMAKNASDLFETRNKAFENLAATGLNKNNGETGQRLALICAPVLEDNIDEALRIFKWGMERNIPVVIAPTMISGKGCEMQERNAEFKQVKLVDLWAKIYVWMIRKKIFTLTQIEEEGISPYPGYACNQYIAGMLVRKDGQVQACPGNENPKYCRDVRKQPLKDIWKNSLGYKLREQLIRAGRIQITQPCYAKSEEIKTPDGVIVKKGCGAFPQDFYAKVMVRIREKLKEKLE